MSIPNLSRLLLVCLLTASATTVLASDAQVPRGLTGPGGGGGQQGAGPHQPPALPDSTQIVKIVDEMAASLALTDQQKSQVSELHFTHFADAKELMSSSQSDRETHRRKMNGLRKKFENDVKALLDDEQKKKFDEFAKSRDPRSGQSGQPGQRRK